MSPLAFVSETSTAARSHAPQLIDLDGTIFVQLGLFLILTFILTQLLWKPYLRVRQERVSRVDGYRQEAARLETDAAAQLGRVEAQLVEARRVGSSERARARAEAQAAEQQLIAGAQGAAQKTLQAARARLEGTVSSERARLDAQVRVVAAQAATRILGRPVSG